MRKGRLKSSLITGMAIAVTLSVFLLLTAFYRGKHHVKFNLDEYSFIDKKLEKSIEAVIAEGFKDEPNVPLDISFENPCGLIVTTLDFWKETQRDSVVETFDVEIKTHHYEYYGYVEDSLQYWVEGCCMLAGHLCYIFPDSNLFKPTGLQQKISFTTRDEYCPCSEEKLYLKMTGNNKVQVVPFYELLNRYGSIYSCTPMDEEYDSLIKN